MKPHATEEKLIDFRKIISIIHKNLIVLSRDRSRLIMLTIFPMIMITIFGFTSGNIPKHIPTAVVLYETTDLSESVFEAVGSTQVLAIKYVVSTEGEAKALLDRGAVKVIIEIPPGLQDAIENSGTAAITVMVDESDSSIAGTARSTLMAIVQQLSQNIGSQKIAYFQQSVSSASAAMQSQQGKGQYDIIIARSDSATAALKTVDTALAASALAVENSLPNPILIGFGLTKNNTRLVNETQTVFAPGYSALLAQIDASKAENSLVKGAIAGIQQIKQAALIDKAAADAKSTYEAQKQSAMLSSQISEFTGAETDSMIRPLTYAEKQAYGTGRGVVDFLIPAIIALTLFQGAVMGMGRSIAGEKKEGSLTRVFLTPTSNITIILGTLIFYILFELFRCTLMMIFAVNLFQIKIEGSILSLALVMVVYAAVATAIGLFLSSLVKSEQQFMAMSMLISMPTIFLSGAFLPVQAMPSALQKLAAFLPITYAADALRGVMIKGLPLGAVFNDVLVLLLFLVIMLIAVFITFRRDIE
jgi:ABC-2 type transport system permease protein